MGSGLPVTSYTRDASLTLHASTCEDLGERGDLCLSRYIPALGLVSPTQTIPYVPTLGVARPPTLAHMPSVTLRLTGHNARNAPGILG